MVPMFLLLPCKGEDCSLRKRGRLSIFPGVSYVVFPERMCGERIPGIRRGRGVSGSSAVWKEGNIKSERWELRCQGEGSMVEGKFRG